MFDFRPQAVTGTLQWWGSFQFGSSKIRTEMGLARIRRDLISEGRGPSKAGWSWSNG
jgi:hypothetical protein